MDKNEPEQRDRHGRTAEEGVMWRQAQPMIGIKVVRETPEERLATLDRHPEHFREAVRQEALRSITLWSTLRSAAVFRGGRGLDGRGASSGSGPVQCIGTLPWSSVISVMPSPGSSRRRSAPEAGPNRGLQASKLAPRQGDEPAQGGRGCRCSLKPPQPVLASG